MMKWFEISIGAFLFLLNIKRNFSRWNWGGGVRIMADPYEVSLDRPRHPFLVLYRVLLI